MNANNKKAIFKMAHMAAKKVHVAGESYAVTFGAALRNIWNNIRSIQAKVKPVVDSGLRKLETRHTAKGVTMFLMGDKESLNLSNAFDLYGKKAKMLLVNIAIDMII